MATARPHSSKLNCEAARFGQRADCLRRFLVDYAWHARGHGYANTVTQEQWKVFDERLNAALTQLGAAERLPEKDPYFWIVGLRVAQGQAWPRQRYNRLVAQARAAEPTFWPIETERANSLLPRSFGEPGVWKKFAEESIARPNGPSAEVYARIVMALQPYYGNIFRESKASWPATREGMAILRQKYPQAETFWEDSALLATLAEDQVVAKEMFAHLGKKYAGNLGAPERFVRARHWARTGEGFANIPPLPHH